MSGKGTKGWGKWSITTEGCYAVCELGGCVDFKIDLATCETREDRYKWLESLKSSRLTQKGQVEVLPDYDLVGLRRLFNDVFEGEVPLVSKRRVGQVDTMAFIKDKSKTVGYNG